MDFVDEHIFWRRDYHPEDEAVIKLHEQNQEAFKNTEQKTIEVLRKLFSRLKSTSMP